MASGLLLTYLALTIVTAIILSVLFILESYKLALLTQLIREKPSFFDINTEIVGRLFIHNIYDKRRDFNYDILGLPSFRSNITYQYDPCCDELPVL